MRIIDYVETTSRMDWIDIWHKNNASSTTNLQWCRYHD